MNKNTEYYVKRVKLLTKQRSKLWKERKKIKEGFVETFESDYDDGFDEIVNASPKAANADRNERISTIDRELIDIDIELFIIENAALRHLGAKLSPSAKRNGFITNVAYANYKLDEMMEKYGKEEIDRYLNSSHSYETISPLGLYGDVLDARNEMTEKEANKISRR